MKKRLSVTTVAVLVAALVATVAASLGSASAANPASTGAVKIEGTFLGVSPAVRDLAPSDNASGTAQPRVNPLADEPDNGSRGTRSRGNVPADPLAASSRSDGRTPAPGLVFNGLANPAACGGCRPPDTIGDVGPNHYVQMTNATPVAIFNKSGGLLTSFDLGDLWPVSDCDDNDGDPVPLYDPLADRWILSQFQVDTEDLCFAVSTSPDPTGTYNLYEFFAGNMDSFPDYFKVGVWPDAYYVSANQNTYTAFAFDRSNMLAGNAATGLKVNNAADNFLLPADIDGTTPPPGGGLFYTFLDEGFYGGGPDRIELYQFVPDFVTPGNSTYALMNTFPIAPFTYTVCGFFNLDCIPQGGTANTVDAVSEWPMHRFAYRNLGSHQALVGNFTVGGGSTPPGAAIRWFELRNTGGGWGLFQEGTHDPGGLNRFMGSIAMDGAGNIALGYSASSSGAFPSIRYATRCATDPPGTMGAEQVMLAGGGSQLPNGGAGDPRWGDYSAMSSDPANNSTFWYTNEYYNPSSTTNWKTAIGNFGPVTSADCAGAGAGGAPSNEFTFGKLKRNKKKGTATLTVNVPGPGTLVLTGKGLVKQRPARSASISKTVSAAGNVKLKIKSKGKKRKKLNKAGKVKVKAKVTYTPTGGTANSKTKKIKLKKKLRR